MQRFLYILVVACVFLMNTQHGFQIPFPPEGKQAGEGDSEQGAANADGAKQGAAPQQVIDQQADIASADVEHADSNMAQDSSSDGEASAPRRTIKLGIVDILIWLVFGVWLLSMIIGGNLRNIKLPPAVVLLMPAAAAVTIIFSGASGGVVRAAVETFKLVQYFVIGFVVFANFGDTAERLRTLIYAFLAAAGVVVVWAVVDYIRADNLFYASGPFGNMNVLGAWLGLALPFALAIAVFADLSLWLRIVLIVAALVGVVMIIPAAALAAAIAAMLLVLALRSEKWLAVGCVGVLAGFLLLPNILHENHPKATVSSAAVYVYDNHLLLTEDARLADAKKLYEANRYSFVVRLLQPLQESGRLNSEGLGLLLKADEHVADSDDPFRQVEAVRYRRWQAALDAVSNRATGYGLGNYKIAVGQFYTWERGYPTDVPAAFNIGIDQPDSYNQFLKLAVEMGVAGVVAFLWFYLWGLMQSIRLFARATTPFARGVGAGVLASLVFLPVLAAYSEILVHGVALPFVFLICCVYLPGRESS